ncbi:hypothetical protein AGMMS49938_09170 [Fibrobacterales bacterium]|nr:hypothetical protein AGMMS49938_09170 [Fibrobacterales bacterium]
MFFFRKILVNSAVVFFTLIGAGFSQAAYSDLTLADCIDIAKKNSLTIASARLNEKTAKSGLEQAKNARLPGLSGSVSQRVSGSPLVNSDVKDGFSVGLNTSMPIFTAGRISNSIDNAEYRENIAKLSVEQSSRDLAEQVIRSYLQVWSLTESLNAAQDALLLSKKNLSKDSVLFNAGSYTASDLSLAFAQFASDSLGLIQAQSNLTQSFTTLRQLLEIPLGTSLTLAPPDSIATETTPSYQTLLLQAEQNSIGKKIDSLSLLAANSQIGVANAARYPSLNLNGGLGTGLSWQVNDPKYNTQLKNSFDWQASLTLSIPIIDWGAAQDGVLQAQVAQEKAQITAQNTQKQLENSVEQLAIQSENYRLQWQVSSLQVSAQQLALDKAVQQHELGLLDISSLIQAQTIFNNSQIKHNQAKYNYLLTRSVLDLYLGK